MGQNEYDDTRDAAPISHDDEHMSIGRYAATRFSTLKPPMAKAPNPFKLLAMLNKQQWLFFSVTPTPQHI